LGEYWIALKDGRRLQLQQLAFRVFDLSENKAAYAAFVAQYEDELAQKKRALKIARAASRP
jgi:DNA-binding transcriptional regulator PaaX